MSPSRSLCPACSSADTTVFHSQKNIPVHSVLTMKDPETAGAYTRGDLRLTFCRSCGFVFNSVYDQLLQEYSGRCEETQGFSSVFSAFARNAAGQLVDRYDLHGKRILEIGSGKGEFLALLCTLGGNTGIGFDPAYVDGRLPSESIRNVTFVKDFFNAKHSTIQADFICCRMTLEHIGDVGTFIETVGKTAGNRSGTIVHFQIPDARRIFSECAFEDIYYEHCSYFSPVSLSRLFRRNGFGILDIRNEYEGQYLVIEAVHGEPGIDGNEHDDAGSLERFAGTIESFPERLEERKAGWKTWFSGRKHLGKKIFLWGSGSKAVSFLTTLGITDEIENVVDINPFRQDTFMPGTGHRIVPPERLAADTPDTVIVMNSIYVREIKAKLETMGIAPEILTLETAFAGTGKV